MALFLRGNVWWMEYRTRKIRKVVSTGFKVSDKAKAESAYAALRLAMAARPKRSALEGVLSAIYDDEHTESGIPLQGVWAIYEDWCAGKGRKVSHSTYVNRRNLVSRSAVREECLLVDIRSSLHKLPIIILDGL